MQPLHEAVTILTNVALGALVLGALWAVLGVFFGIAVRVAYWVIQL
jgi:hypothetical protein